MAELVARDGAARRLVWTLADTVHLTPLALSADAAGLPALPTALPLSRAPLARPGVSAGGSRFTPTPAGAPRGALDIADKLPYGVDEALMQAGDAENLTAYQPGAGFVALSPDVTLPADAEFVVMGNARGVFDNPYVFADHIVKLRAAAGPERVLYAPGLGMPSEIALLAYCGVDVVDDLAAVLAARAGKYVTPEGVLPAEAITAGPRPCACPACQADDGPVDLVLHARHAVQLETARVAAAIQAGKLRELVEQRTRVLPDLAAHLRRLDKEHGAFFGARAPLLRAGRLYATSKESIDRPEVVRFRERIATRYQAPRSARILVLLPCSASKPYSLSRTHKILETALYRVPNRHAVHEVVLTSPLGVVPRELEGVYPAAQYDLPVTGHWDHDEQAMIRDTLTALLERARYDHVVVHLDEVEMEIAAPVLGDFTYTCEGSPLSRESLDNLANTLGKLASALPRVGQADRRLDDMESLARYQFGAAGATLTQGSYVKGRKPYLKLLDAATKDQVGMTTPERGLLSLAELGGQRLLAAGAYGVDIDDFRPKGTIYAVGVRGADADIVPEDDVVLHHGGDYRGVGRALAPGVEMAGMTRGECVATRKASKKDKGGR